MKNLKSLLQFLILSVTMATHTFAQGKIDKVKNFAVLELFTSEGCSSCPPADELMGRIQKEYADSPVYLLAYHVDYWDKQGWKDIFSDAAYTKRQYEYANWFQSESVYTPQLVINGKTECIASQETTVRSEIKKALLKPAPVQLNLKMSLADNKLAVNYTVTGNSENCGLMLAIVQKTARSAVKRGENADRVLTHFQIVRHLHNTTLNRDGKGTTGISLPEDFNTKDFEVIGFVQNRNTGAILDAVKAVF